MIPGGKATLIHEHTSVCVQWATSNMKCGGYCAKLIYYVRMEQPRSHDESESISAKPFLYRNTESSSTDVSSVASS